MSVNVRGINCKYKRHRIFESLRCANSDVVFLQETFICTDNRKQECESDWSGQSVWHLSKDLQSKGVAVLFRPELTVKILGTRGDSEGRFLIIDCEINNPTLDKTHKTYRLINVYFPNSPPQRASLVNILTGLLTSNYVIVLGGDFNFVENAVLDKIKGSKADTKDEATRQLFNKLKSDHEITDTFRSLHPTKKEFTFTSPTTLTGVRSDRFYISDTQLHNVTSASHLNITDCDHLAACFTFSSGTRSQGRGYWKCNVKVLNDIHFQADLTALYARLKCSPITPNWWDKCKQEFKKLIINHSSRLADNFRRRVNNLNSLLTRTKQLNLTADGFYDYRIQSLEVELKTLLDEKINGCIIRAKAMHLDADDKPSRFFLKLERHNGNSKLINHLTVNGVKVDRQADISVACRNYYVDLLSKNKIDNSVWTELTEQLPSLSEYDSDLCELPVTYDECLKAINSMADHKSPGCDGLPAEFYKLFFNIFGHEFVYLINNHGERLSDSQRIGIISLICKDMAKADDLGSWRPISLLNVDLKIMSKVIFNKLKLVAPDIIGPEQTCGLPRRSVFENVHFLRNVFDYCKERDLPCIALCFDQAKAFDSVDHSYLFFILGRLGFGPKIINLIKLLYTDIQSTVLVNGTFTELFSVTRSMRQGCGLSPLLYAFCIEPLINKIRSSLLFKGIPLLPPHKSEARIAAHADDTTILALDTVSVNLALNVFQMYSLASGAKLNTSKSIAFIPAKKPLLNGWPPWLKICPTVKICGITFGPDAQLNMEASLKTRLDNNFNLLAPRRLTHLGRAVILNNVIFSKLWYMATVLVFSDSFLLWLERRTYKYLWPRTEKIKRGTVCLPVKEGGLGLVDVRAKCQTLRTKHAFHLMANPDSPWAVFASYWTAIPLRRYSIAHWSNITPHSTSDNNPFYNAVISDFKIFKLKYPDYMSPHLVNKVAYSLFMRERSPLPRVMDSADAELVCKCWAALKRIPLSCASRDLIWQASHDTLQVAFLRFKCHMINHNLCVRCFTAVETIEHALVLCPIAIPIWEIVYDLIPEIKPWTARNILLLNLPHNDQHDLNFKAIIVAEAMHLNWLLRNKKCFDDIDSSPRMQRNMFFSSIRQRIQSDHSRWNDSLFNAVWSKRKILLHALDNGNITVAFDRR